MIWDSSAFVILLIGGSIVSAIAAISAWNRTYIRGSRTFSAFLVVSIFWALLYAAELWLMDYGAKLIAAKLQYLVIPLTVPIGMMFVAAVSGHQWQTSRWLAILIGCFTLLTNLILWIRPELIWAEIMQRSTEAGFQFDLLYGPWFYVVIVYQYLAFAAIFWLTIRLVIMSPTMRRIDSVVLMIGILVPFVSNLARVIGIELVRGFDLTPIALVTFGLMSAWALFEFRPNDILPVIYRSAFESLPDPSFTLDENERVRTVNPAAELHFTRQAADLYGAHIRDVIPTDWANAVSAVSKGAVVSQEVTANDGEQLNYYDLRVTPILDNRNRYKGRLFVLRNITRRRTAMLQLAKREQALSVAVDERTAELQATNADLMRAVQLKDEFLASMSHELRTPLSAVIGTAEALQSEIYGAIMPAQSAPLGRIEQSADHLMSLINDILNMSKIEAGQETLRISAISVQELCQTCINQVRPDAERRDITVRSAFDLTQQMILVDARRVRQILINLLYNAVKFTGNGGKIGLTVREDTQKRETHFVVWDTGIGISPENQARIFKPFVQVDSSLSRQYQGTGLGLALSRSFAAMHGGSIDILSEPEVGSRFTVTLPWDSRVTATVGYEESSAHALGLIS